MSESKEKESEIPKLILMLPKRKTQLPLLKEMLYLARDNKLNKKTCIELCNKYGIDYQRMNNVRNLLLKAEVIVKDGRNYKLNVDFAWNLLKQWLKFFQ